VSGPVLAVDDFTTGRTVWERRRLGLQASAVVVGPLAEADRNTVTARQLALAPLTLQELLVSAADRSPHATLVPGPQTRTSA
jgi:ABC-2 type transport system ATP-binding protein